MGYTMEFWSLPLSGVPGGDILQVVEQVRAAGILAGTIDHGSAGGEWFRDEFLGHLTAALLGDATAQHLLQRPMDGVTSTPATAAYPSLGWLSHQEITEALAHASHPATVGADSDDTDLLDTVLAALHRCTADLVTIYS
jgi:hypothetical protein